MRFLFLFYFLHTLTPQYARPDRVVDQALFCPEYAKGDSPEIVTHRASMCA